DQLSPTGRGHAALSAGGAGGASGRGQGRALRTDVEKRAPVLVDEAQTLHVLEQPLRAPPAKDEHGPRRVCQRAGTARLALEPVDVEPLVAPVEGVERIAHPYPAAGLRDLLGEQALGEHGSAAGLP